MPACLACRVVFEEVQLRPASWPCLACQVVFEKGRIALQAGHASPVKWCLNEKVLLGKWSAIAMLELQRIWFAGWALTEGQHRPKAGKKRVFFSGSHFALDASSGSGLTDFSPFVISIYLSIVHPFIALKRTSPG